MGFTAFTEEHGDDAAADVAMRFTAVAAGLAKDHGVTLVKCLGDGVLLRGDDAARTLRLGLALKTELDGLLPIHAGAHTGCAVERGGDWFGSAVNLAARVSDSARGGELLVTEATVAAAGSLRDVELESLGPQLFRNIAEPVSVYAARGAIQVASPARALQLPWRRPAVQPAAA